MNFSGVFILNHFFSLLEKKQIAKLTKQYLFPLFPRCFLVFLTLWNDSVLNKTCSSLKAILYLFADFSVLHVLCYWCQWKGRSEEAVIFISFMQSCTRAPLWTHVTILSTSVNIRIHKILVHKGLRCQHTGCTFVFSCCCLKRSKFFHWGMSAFYSLGA